VTFRTTDKYNTDRSRAILDRLRPHYEERGRLAGREIYFRSDRVE
jgi:hypothetical protein